jgi:hypothetical protein
MEQLPLIQSTLEMPKKMNMVWRLVEQKHIVLFAESTI